MKVSVVWNTKSSKKEDAANFVDHGDEDGVIGSELDDHRAERVHGKQGHVLGVRARRRTGGEDSSERVYDLRGVVGEVDFPCERADGDDGRLSDLLAHVGPVEELEDGGEDEMVVLFDAQAKGSKGVQNLNQDFVPSRIREIAVERAEHLLKDPREEGLELAFDSSGDNLDELDDDRLELRMIPVFEDEGEDWVEEVSDVEFDDGDERSKLGEPGSLISGRAAANCRDKCRDDL